MSLLETNKVVEKLLILIIHVKGKAVPQNTFGGAGGEDL
jgi:hypothetical protein